MHIQFIDVGQKTTFRIGFKHKNNCYVASDFTKCHKSSIWNENLILFTNGNKEMSRYNIRIKTRTKYGEDPMEYTEDVKKAAELTRMVLPTLGRLQIPVNPINYALWYEYYLGTDEELNAELDEIQSGAQPYEEKKTKDLFLRLIVDPGVAMVERIGDEVRRLLSNATVMMTDAGNDMAQYGDVLGHSKGQLEGDYEIGDVQLVAKSLLNGTKAMIETNKRFEKKLQTATEEMSHLRQELSETRQQASLDSLTGLANRKTFDEALKRAIDTAAREETNLCLMMVDIDHFKKVNDQHGHLIGDKVIKFVAATLKNMVKGKDLVARYGGEEFSIILEETPTSGALGLAESIRVAIEKSRLKRTDNNEPLGTITISVGMDSMQTGDDNESLIKRADKALYHSKNTGRNRISNFREL